MPTQQNLAHESSVTLTATMPAEVAEQLADLCAGLTFESALCLTDKTQPVEERERRAHLIIGGIESVRQGLGLAGYHTR